MDPSGSFRPLLSYVFQTVLVELTIKAGIFPGVIKWVVRRGEALEWIFQNFRSTLSKEESVVVGKIDHIGQS